MATASAVLRDVELSEVAAAVGPRSFDRGLVYARGGRVATVEWDAAAEALTGSVVGHGALYETAVYFVAGRDGVLAFEDGECTCPVGYNCKHVAAIVIAATDNPGAGRRGPARRDPGAPATPVAPPASWERPLRALIDAPAAQATGSPLAIELALHQNGAAGGGA